MSETQMREHLREAYSQDPEESFFSDILRRLADPAKPKSEKGLPHPHPFWFQLGILAFLALLFFLSFTFARP